MRYFTLNKDSLESFVNILKETHKIVAPVKKENQFVFAEPDSFSEIKLEYIPTVLPPKKYFLPQTEELLKFKFNEVKSKVVIPEKEPTAIFGMYTCDIAGIACLGSVFHNEPIDDYFFQREKSIIIIGYECMKPCDEYATCVTMDTLIPRGFYDIMITDAKKYYIFHINSIIGMNVINKIGLFKEENERTIKQELQDLRVEKLKKFDHKLSAAYAELYKIFEKSYKNSIWADDVGKRCVSCGNCTAVCPTCYCFDLYDKLDMKISEGNRMRTWDSCQLNDFAVVAGGENFRKARSSRQRHRYFRKFFYSVNKYKKYFCVGCGRCTRTCMAKISLIETVNNLTKEYRNG